MNALEAALWYVERGFNVIPVPWGEKAPVIKGWQQLRLNEASKLAEYFSEGNGRNGQPSNIGVLLGEPHNLCDVDLDVPEARWAWTELGIASGMSFGRRSNPESHHFFRCSQPARTRRYLDPLDFGKNCLLELRGLASNGKPGLSTVVPPSKHPSGELYEFVIGHSHTPSEVDRDAIERAVRTTAAAALVGRHAKAGAYHQLFLALAGALARCGWQMEEASQLLRAIYRVIWRDEADLTAAETEASSTFRRYEQADVNITGLRTLGELLEPRIFQTVKQWLGLREDASTPKARPHKIQFPDFLPLGALRNKQIVMPDELIKELIVTPGLTLLVGAPKTGKTILAVQMGMSLAAGVPLMDNFRLLGQSSVALLQWDDKQGESSLKKYLIKSRTGALIEEESPWFHYALQGDEALNLTHPEFLPWLHAKILEYKAGFVVLDHYTALRGIRSGGHDVVKVESADLRMLADLAAQTKTAIVLIHHGSKSAAGLNWSSRAAGSFAMHAGPNCQIYMERFSNSELGEGAPYRLVHLESRQLREKTMVIRFREDSMDFDFVMEGPASSDFASIQKLHRAFQNRFTAKEAKDVVGWTLATAYRQLNKLIGYSILRKESSAFAWDLTFNRKDL